MKELTKQVAYLIKNGVPYERAIAMSPAEAKAAARTMRQVENRSPAGKILTVIGGLVAIAFGLTGLCILYILFHAVG